MPFTSKFFGSSSYGLEKYTGKYAGSLNKCTLHFILTLESKRS